MKNILDTGLRSVTRAQNMKPYDRYGVVDPDFEWLPLSGKKGGECECFFIRFKPGARAQHRMSIPVGKIL